MRLSDPLRRLVILHEGEDDWADEVAAAVDTVAVGVTQRSVLVKRSSLDDALGDPVSPGLVLVLANGAAGTSSQIADGVDRARAGSLGVLPVAGSLAGVSSSLPESLRAINAFEWADPDEGAPRIAALLGLVESERKLSCRTGASRRRGSRSSCVGTSPTGNSTCDRFSVPPGVDFQQRLTQELAYDTFHRTQPEF